MRTIYKVYIEMDIDKTAILNSIQPKPARDRFYGYNISQPNPSRIDYLKVHHNPTQANAIWVENSQVAYVHIVFIYIRYQGQYNKGPIGGISPPKSSFYPKAPKYNSIRTRCLLAGWPLKNYAMPMRGLGYFLQQVYV